MTARHVISFKGAKGIKVLTDNITPFALKGQFVLYSESDNVRDGDYVVCSFKDKPGPQFKQLVINPETKGRHLLPVTPQDKEKILFDKRNLKFIYRIVGIVTMFE